jgi:hypothetical protein
MSSSEGSRPLIVMFTAALWKTSLMYYHFASAPVPGAILMEENKHSTRYRRHTLCTSSSTRSRILSSPSMGGKSLSIFSFAARRMFETRY